MEKLKLKNNKEIKIENGATPSQICAIIADLSELKVIVTELTEENLERVELLNDADTVCDVWKDKTFTGFAGVPIADTGNWRITFNLGTVDPVQKQLKLLTERQGLLDDAVAEMSETVYA